MYRRSLYTPMLLVFLATASMAGCAAAHAPDDGSDESLAEQSEPRSDAVSKKLPAPAVAAQRLYFPNSTRALPFGGGATAFAYPAAGATAVSSYWVFGGAGGSTFDVSIAAIAEDSTVPDAKLSLAVYYLYAGKWRRYRSGTGLGAAHLSIAPTYDHQWLIAAKGDVGDGNWLEIDLGCASTADASGRSACAISQEPGDVCGARGLAQCDANTYCRFGASCGAGDVPGTCAQLPTKGCDDVKTHLPTGAPVCGCDGVTYPNECYAETAGVSVASAAACGAPPSCDWTGTPTGLTTLTSELWRTEDLKRSYTFESDGTFRGINDPCAAPPGVVHCMIAVTSKTGKYFVKGQNIQLAYDDGTVSSLAYQQDCKGAFRLDGDDFSTHVDALDAGKR